MKRKLAGLLSLTMILSSMSINVFAEDIDTMLNGGTGNNATGISAQGGGDVNSVDTVKYRVILPIDPKLDYVADPQGLAQLGTNGSQDVSEITGGKIYSNGEVVIANRSSKDIKVTATVEATDQQTTDTTATVVKVKDAITKTNGVDSGDNPEVVLAVVPSEAEFVVDTNGSEYNKNVAGSETTKKDTQKYTATTQTSSTDSNKIGYKLKAVSSETKVEVPVVLKKAEYKATATSNGYTYDVSGDSVGGAVSFSLAGYCSTNDVWAKDSDKMLAPDIHVTYKFANATTDEITALGTKAIDVVDTQITSQKVEDLQTSPLILVNVDDDNVSVAKTGVTLKLFATDSANEAVKTNIATKPVAVTYLKVGDGSVVTNATADVADDGTITITNTDLASAAADTEVVVKISYDGKLYVAKGSVVIPPTAATATATTEAITIDAIDGVAGIEDVEFTVMVDGEDDPIDVTAALDEDNNIVLTPEEGALEADDKLTITFTIGTTNYKAEATVVEADVAPSIATKSYTMSKGNDVKVNVSLGSGDLAATGISQIKYTKSSGEAVLDTSNYTFADGVLTIKSSYVDGVLDAGITSRKYSIIFNDTAKTAVEITLAKS